MIKNIIISYDTALVNYSRDYESDIVWDKLTLYFNYMGLEAESIDLKKNYDKAVTSLSNTKSAKDEDIDIEDVFYKLFKKYKFKAKKKQIKELAILFQILTTKHLKINKKIIPIIEYAKEKDLKLYGVADGQWPEIKNELSALMLRDLFEMIHCSSIMGLKKSNPLMLQGLLDTYGFKKKETVYITSGPKEEIEMAQRVGVKVVYLGESELNGLDCVGDGQKILEYITK